MITKPTIDQFEDTTLYRSWRKLVEYFSNDLIDEINTEIDKGISQDELTAETNARKAADENLQEQIDAIPRADVTKAYVDAQDSKLQEQIDAIPGADVTKDYVDTQDTTLDNKINAIGVTAEFDTTLRTLDIEVNGDTAQVVIPGGEGGGSGGVSVIENVYTDGSLVTNVTNTDGSKVSSVPIEIDGGETSVEQDANGITIDGIALQKGTASVDGLMTKDVYNDVKSTLPQSISDLEGEVYANQTDITSLQDRATALEETTGTQNTDITQLKADVSRHETDITNLEATISTHSSNITQLQNDVSAQTTVIDNIDSATIDSVSIEDGTTENSIRIILNDKGNNQIYSEDYVFPTSGSSTNEWDIINPENLPTDFKEGDTLLLKLGSYTVVDTDSWSTNINDSSTSTKTGTWNIQITLTKEYITTTPRQPIAMFAVSKSDDTTLRVSSTVYCIRFINAVDIWNNTSTGNTLLYFDIYCFNGGGMKVSSLQLTRSNFGTNIQTLERKRA